MVVEKEIGGKPVFMSLCSGRHLSPARWRWSSGGPRTATVQGRDPLHGRASCRASRSASCWPASRNWSPSCAGGDVGAPAQDQRLHREAEGQLRAASVDMYSSVANFLIEQGDRRGHRRAADRREPLRRLRQLREGLRRHPRRHLAAEPRGRHDLRQHPRADLVPALRAPALHDRLPAQRHPARPGRRGVHRRHLHRLRQLPAELPLRRDPDGQAAAEEAAACCRGCCSGAGPGRASRTPPGARRPRRAGSPTRQAVKCDMCSGKAGGPACVRACPTGAAIRVSPENFLSVALLDRGRG